MSFARYFVGDVFDVMAELPDDSYDLVLTSPPFLKLRSYLPDDHEHKAREIGNEETPADYLDTLLTLSAEWGRLITPAGSIAVELGDTYSGSGGGPDPRAGGRTHVGSGGRGWPMDKSLAMLPGLYAGSLAYGVNLLTGKPSPAGKWRIRNLKAWVKSNPVVGELTDKERPATSYVIVACRARNRFFDLDAVRGENTEPVRMVRVGRASASRGIDGGDSGNPDKARPSHNPAGAPPLDWYHEVDAIIDNELDRRAGKASTPPKIVGEWGAGRGISGGDSGNEGKPYGESGLTVGARGVHIRRALEAAGYLSTAEALDVSPTGYRGAHFAVWPTRLVWLLISEMCPPGGRVLDPFAGSGTTLAVATGMGREADGIDLNPEHADLARERVGMFLDVEMSA